MGLTGAVINTIPMLLFGGCDRIVPVDVYNRGATAEALIYGCCSRRNPQPQQSR